MRNAGNFSGIVFRPVINDRPRDVRSVRETTVLLSSYNKKKKNYEGRVNATYYRISSPPSDNSWFSSHTSSSEPRYILQV